MIDDDEQLPSMQRLRDDLVRVAHARYPVREPRTRGRRLRRYAGRHRLLAVAAGMLLAGGAAAGAATLISVGEPVKDRPHMVTSQRPADAEAGSVVVRAADAEAHGSWGLRTYRSRQGLDCVVAGFLRGEQVGIVQGGVFRPYADSVTGSCGRPGAGGIFLSSARFSEPKPRTLVYGLAGTGVRAVRVSVDAGVRTVETGAGGAFLFVLAGGADVTKLDVRPIRAS